MRSYVVETQDPQIVVTCKHDDFWNPSNEDIDPREMLWPVAYPIQLLHLL